MCVRFYERCEEEIDWTHDSELPVVDLRRKWKIKVSQGEVNREDGGKAGEPT